MFYSLLPIFRFPEKFLFVSNVALLVLAAAGIDTLVAHCKKRKLPPAFVSVFLVVVLATDLYISHQNLNPHYSADIYTRPQTNMRPILEDTDLHRVYVDKASPPWMGPPQTLLDHHARWQLLTMPNLGLIQGLSHAGGTSGLELKYQYFITEILSRTWAEKLLFLKLANVKYIVSSQPLMQESALEGQIKNVGPMVYRLEANLPRAWLVGQIMATTGTGLKDILEYDFNPSQSALGPVELATRYRNPFFSPVGEIEYINSNRIKIQIETDRPSVLVLSESAYPGWRVYVNGEENEILWLNLFFQGVEIEAGRHEVEFVYRPENFFLYLGLSVISGIILCLVRRVVCSGRPFAAKT